MSAFDRSSQMAKVNKAVGKANQDLKNGRATDAVKILYKKLDLPDAFFSEHQHEVITTCVTRLIAAILTPGNPERVDLKHKPDSAHFLAVRHDADGFTKVEEVERRLQCFRSSIDWDNKQLDLHMYLLQHPSVGEGSPGEKKPSKVVDITQLADAYPTYEKKYRACVNQAKKQESPAFFSDQIGSKGGRLTFAYRSSTTRVFFSSCERAFRDRDFCSTHKHAEVFSNGVAIYWFEAQLPSEPALRTGALSARLKSVAADVLLLSTPLLAPPSTKQAESSLNAQQRASANIAGKVRVARGGVLHDHPTDAGVLTLEFSITISDIECDAQIDEIHERIKERKRLSATAPLPSPSPSSSLRSQHSSSMKAKQTTFQYHSESDDDDDHYHHSASVPRPRIKPSMSQSVSSSRGILKSSSSSVSSPECPLSISQKQQQQQRGILKKPKEEASMSPATLKESPEQWFQRVMKVKKLSPLDLCDLFSYGDARKHPRVPLSHVCEVLFDLDPEVLACGYDPVTPEMEEFLYQFSFEGESESEIVVNVKDALRSLNIWQSGLTSPVKKSSGSILNPTESESPTKSIVLEAKNKKLQGVISSLQDANLRLSQQLDDAVKSSKPSEPTSDFKAKAQHKQRQRQPFATSSSLHSSVFSSSSWLPNSDSTSDSTKSSVVSHHEDELIKIANHLQYSGVKQLEELLIKSDKPVPNSDSSSSLSGFVSLKQLRWLLAEHFDAAISETSLMESCLGMNFNAQAQLDYSEFISVLLDIIIYAAPKASSPKRQQLYDKILQYLDSGFHHHQSSNTTNKLKAQSYQHHLHMLSALCEKYDLEGDHLISVSEMMRVFYKDLATHHAMNLEFPLSQQDVLRILQPSIKESSDQSGGSLGKGGFLNYPEFLDSLFKTPGDDTNDGPESIVGRLASAKRALDWDCWVKLRKALCSGNLALEPKIHSQMCKIFKKIDPKRQFLISKRNFGRILDQHLSEDDLSTLANALAQPNPSGGSEGKSLSVREHQQPSNPNLRFDVFMKLVFGAPALQDTKFLNQQIVQKLVHNEVAVRENVMALMKKHGGGYEMKIAGAYEVLLHDSNSSETKTPALTMVELLYLFGYLDSGHEGFIELKTLWTFLKDDCWVDASKSEPNRSKQSGKLSKHASLKVGGNQSVSLYKTKQMLARCLNAYNLERTLAGNRKEKQQQLGGSISQDQLLKEICKMLKTLGRDANDDEALDPANLQQLISSIAIQVYDADPELVNLGRLHLPIPIPSFFEALFNWDAMLKALRLPQNLVEVKKVFELFDWSKDGSIPVQDWNKAWRQLCGKEMSEWELRVLQRRFSAGSQEHRHKVQHNEVDTTTTTTSSIDYARLLVHLMDTQHQHARRRLKKLVLSHFRQRWDEMVIVTSSSSSKSGGVGMHQIDRLFRQIDTENRGQFNMRDLQQYLLRVLEPEKKTQSASDSDEDEGGDAAALVQNVNVMGYILSYIADNSHHHNDIGGVVDHQRARATTVTRTRFQEFMQILMVNPSSPKKGRLGRSGGGDEAQDDWVASRSSRRSQHENHNSSLSPHKKTKTQVVTSLRTLELVILDICSDVTSENSRIRPTRAFRYFSEGVIDQASRSRSRSRSRSPTRSASGSQPPTRKTIRSSTSSSMSMTTRSQHREVEAMVLDPITPAKLKSVLLEDHALQVSSHIASQFFLHVGSHSKYFLELLDFAKWVAPLSLEMQCKVRECVKKMIMRSKGGGGQVDLDRFLGQLHRKLLDSPPYASVGNGDGCEELLVSGDLRFVSPSLLQTKLNQLGVPLTRLDMEMLLRHFGMEEDLEIDFALFLQRIVELNASLMPST